MPASTTRWRRRVHNPVAASAILSIFATPQIADASKKKPLFEYDDHYVMLNDYGRNEFYRRALARAVPKCGPDCTVLDVGAGSGLLSMMAAHLGARHVVAIEANPHLAVLAQKTIARNHAKNFPTSNVTVLANLSSAVTLSDLPHGRRAHILVTETFGTMLLGEGAINFVPDARDRLLRDAHTVIPAGGCQYATLVDMPAVAAVMSPGVQSGLNLSRLEMLQDTVYWKASMGTLRNKFTRLSDRVCVLEVDLSQDTKDSIPENRTLRIPVRRPGIVHAVLLDWDIWADASRSETLSTAPGRRNYAGDVAWGWLLQMQEEVDDNWLRYDSRPHQLWVDAGDWVDLQVEYIAKGISVHVRTRKAQLASVSRSAPTGAVPRTYDAIRSPPRMRGLDRSDLVEANEFYLPVAGDTERHQFYQRAVDTAMVRNSTNNANPILLDCSSNAGVPAMSAAKRYGVQALTLTRRNDFARLLRGVAEDNGLDELVEFYAMDPRDMFDTLLPRGERADIVILDPPGTPLHGASPFAVLPSIRKRLMKEGGRVIPSGGCFEVGLIDSADLAETFSVPGGHWQEVDLTVWNEEARRQGLLERLVPYTKWFGKQSTMNRTWLSTPQCVFEIDFLDYADAAFPPETRTLHGLLATADGHAHALVARWVVWDQQADRMHRLTSDSDYLGRGLTWPHYVQALAMPNTSLGVLHPMVVHAGEEWQLEVVVRQGVGKRSGTAGPEFSFQLLGKLPRPPPEGFVEL